MREIGVFVIAALCLLFVALMVSLMWTAPADKLDDQARAIRENREEKERRKYVRALRKAERKRWREARRRRKRQAEGG